MMSPDNSAKKVVEMYLFHGKLAQHAPLKPLGLVFLLLGLLSHALIGHANQRVAVPSDEDIRKAKSEIQDFYDAELSETKTSQQQGVFAEALLEDARVIKGDPRSKYALFMLARSKALSANDIELTLRIADEIAESFEISPERSKALAICAIDKAKMRLGREEGERIARDAVLLIDPLVAENDIDLAFKLATYAAETAKGARDFPLYKIASDFRNDVVVLRRETIRYVRAKEQLKQGDSAEACRIAGLFECLALNKWTSGLELLARSGDVNLRQLANETRDLLNDKNDKNDNEKSVKLADEWWKRISALEGRKKRVLANFSSKLYQRGLDSLDDREKERVAKRIEEAHKISALALGKPIQSSNELRFDRKDRRTEGSQGVSASKKLARLRDHKYPLLRSEYIKFDDAFQVSYSSGPNRIEILASFQAKVDLPKPDALRVEVIIHYESGDARLHLKSANLVIDGVDFVKSSAGRMSGKEEAKLIYKPDNEVIQMFDALEKAKKVELKLVARSKEKAIDLSVQQVAGLTQLYGAYKAILED
ncbi:hypothetical protein [Adhaeretor mobilis]|uniref:Uncharacterized protein n=1 Tax=Adhaeretor mobilis TaxID=1930276 RepID=A0A517MS46_9BACT|nr:hypothetical protein [Adhaeretor mobilis]QDS97694.1 hypothetical protein HG15A2_09580 [Adhaeretor mobilis]